MICNAKGCFFYGSKEAKFETQRSDRRYRAHLCKRHAKKLTERTRFDFDYYTTERDGYLNIREIRFLDNEQTKKSDSR